MNSPFPGMDPYLESHWRDVHHRLVMYSSDAIQSSLPGDLRARVEERVFVESPLGGGREAYPDVRVVEYPRGRGPAPLRSGGAGIAEPLVLHVPVEEISEGYIQIIEAGSGNRVVTVIEFLSVTNKRPGQGQELYLLKQQELMSSTTSLVEIDLLRAGKRVLMAGPHDIPPSHRTTYQACVRRGWKPGRVEVYRLPLREPLPAIRIPLRETDDDAILDLQALIDQCYRNGRYDDLDYAAEPEPPLDPEDAAWADGLLREQGMRPTP
jgi:hypothetical protein